MSAFVCQVPEHEGDRFVAAADDRIKVSLDFMSADNSVRVYRIHQADVCRSCAERWVGRLRPKPLVAQGTLL